MSKIEKNEKPFTYVFAIYGLTECHVLLTAGRAKIRIPFTGGMLSAYGQRPATFSTTNRVIAKLIADSDEFKKSKIIRIQ